MHFVEYMTPSRTDTIQMDGNVDLDTVTVSDYADVLPVWFVQEYQESWPEASRYDVARAMKAEYMQEYEECTVFSNDTAEFRVCVYIEE